MEVAPTVVVVPVKAFDRAKARLADRLGPAERATLARHLADGVLAASHPLPVTVVCDDDAVAAWARAAGADVAWTPGLGLNGAVDAALAELARAGVRRAVVAHADLPFPDGLPALADAGDDEALLVPDRHGDGTNVASVPLGRGFAAAYGAGSFGRHAEQCRRLGLSVRVVDAEGLRWDVDAPDDLDPPAHLGTLPPAGTPA
jgi:2-phospho-L-lactate guanylyltransferase